MKKSSKIVSLLLAVLMAVSCITGLSFASVAAAEENAINFRVPSEWKDAGEILAVYCHIYHIYGDDSDFVHPAWKNKYEKADYDSSTGIATFNDTNIYDRKDALVHSQLEDGNDYGVLFVCTYKDTSIADKQTGNVLVSTECYGGTIYVTGNFTENTEDSSKLDAEAKWEDEKLSEKYGPVLGITSTGKIINDYIPVNMPKAQPIAQFIGTYAKSATNSQYVTPEIVQGMMNDSRFQVSAKDVMDVYADIYAADLEAGTATVATLDEVAAIVGYVEEPDTTEEPTTEEPTTEEPTTEEPTTVPTTQFANAVYGDANLDGNITIDDATLVQKAGINLVQLTEEQEAVANVNPAEDDVINIIDVTYIQKWIAGGYKNTAYVGLEYTEPVDTYVVAGSEEVFGLNWVGTLAEAPQNQMTEVDGLYTLTLTDVQEIKNAQFKIVKNDTEWIGPEVGNYAFNVVTPCDVTITYDPATGDVQIIGEGVTDVAFELESLRAVGNGGAGWLNDVAWDPAEDANLMTEVSEGVYQLVMTDVESLMEAEFKFAANGNWSDSWGGVFEGLDVTSDAVYNGDNIKMSIGEGDSDENLYTVTLTLDLSAFDYATKTGAKFTVSQKVQEEEPDTTVVTEPETTEATEPETTEATEPETTEATEPETTEATEPETTEATEPETTEPETTAPSNTKTIYFDNSKTQWDTVVLYQWSVGTTAIVLEPVEGAENIYSAVIDKGITAGLFKNLDSLSDWDQQTADVAGFEDGKMFVPFSGENKTNGEWVDYSTEPETTEPETTEATEPETTEPGPVPTPDTYVVAGVSAVFGVEWDGTAVANMMSDEDGDGVYTLTIENVQPIVDAEFKIVKNGTDWIGPKDAVGVFDNFKFTVEAVSNVTFSYNVAENDVTVNIVPVGDVEETTDATEPETTEETTEPETSAPAPETFTLYVKTNLTWVTEADAKIYVVDGSTDTNVQLVQDTAAYPIVFTAEVPTDLTSVTINRVNPLDETEVWNSWTASGISSTDNCVRIIDDAEVEVAPYVAETKPEFTLSRVYFDNSASQWSEVYVYGWAESGLGNAAVAMTQIEGTDIWYYDFATPLSPKANCFLFKDTGDSTWVNQSDNAVVQDGMNCWVQSASGKSGTWTNYAE